MTMKPGAKDFLWMVVGAALLLAIMLVVLSVEKDHHTPAALLALRTRKIELVDRMRLGLASSSEAEKSAVMAITDQDSQSFADQARAASAAVEQERGELGKLLEARGSRNEKDLLAHFSQAFAEFQRIDNELLNLAVKNTNLKAYSLAFGPAAETLKEMDAALSHLITDGSNSISPDDLKKEMLLAFDARIAALRIQTLLPPHIAEESDQKMDEMEALMAGDDRQVQNDLAGLAAIQNLKTDADLEKAVSSYARFGEIRAQIIKLSRENTNVRSLTISLNQKRKVMLVCQDDLAALEQAIKQESIGHTPVSPR